MPRRSATTSSNASRIEAGALMVIEIETRSSGMLSKSRSMSSIESMATPTLPTSPRARGSSESIPICAGRSAPVAEPRAENRHALRQEQGCREKDLLPKRPGDLFRIERSPRVPRPVPDEPRLHHRAGVDEGDGGPGAVADPARQDPGDDR